MNITAIESAIPSFELSIAIRICYIPACDLHPIVLLLLVRIPLVSSATLLMCSAVKGFWGTATAIIKIHIIISMVVFWVTMEALSAAIR